MLAIVLLLALSLRASAYCGDDICGSGESCDNCVWDCGVCDDTEGSGGGVVVQSPVQKTVSIWDGGPSHINCNLSYSSYISSAGINTSVRFRILNPSGSSTGAFRLTLSSSLGWFAPKNLTYALPPDGYTGSGMPYWDMPPLGPGESTEIFFLAKGSVGLINMISVGAEPLMRWQGGCSRFVPYSGTGLNQNISQYLDSLNVSQNARVYFLRNGMALAHLEGNGSFAAFSVNDTNVTVIDDGSTIGALVSDYAAAASSSSADTSKPFSVLSYSRQLKAGAEKSCMMITGMDKFNCTDRTTCRYACASVPACWYVGQVGWPFIDCLLAYRISVDSANAALDRAVNSSYSFSQAPSLDAADEALSDIKGLNRYETAVIYQPIFTTYNFCPPPEYALPQMIDARRQLLDYMEGNCVQAEKARMISESVAIAPGLKAAEEAAAARAAAEALAAAQALANITNASMNASANATMNASANVTGPPASITANATGNVTVGQNASGNATAMQNISGANATIPAHPAANATMNQTTGNASANKTVAAQAEEEPVPCPVPGLLSAALVLCVISLHYRKKG